MNDEIKEILDKLSKEENYIQHSYCKLFNYEVNTLLDYITNLQQEKEKLEIALQNIQEDYDRRIEENERLKHQLNQEKPNYLQIWQLEDRIDKAVEYIKENITYYYDEDLDESVYQDEVSGDKLLNILQNGSDDK